MEPVDFQPADKLHKDIYQNLQLTLGAALVIIMTYSQKFKVSGSALANLIQMLHLFLPKSNLLPKSMYHFKKFFKDIAPKVKNHFFL